MMSVTRDSIVLIPEHFGSLLFERRECRYLAFDHEATQLFKRLHRTNIQSLLVEIDDDVERRAVFDFYRHYEARGYFTTDGYFNGEMLDLQPPKTHLAGPMVTHLEVIAACNLSCSHCFAGDLPRNENPLSVVEIDGLFGQLAKIGCFRAGLTGGEPLMRRDIFDILDAADARGVHTSLTTNGMFFDERTVLEFGKRPNALLTVSLDGPDAESNDLIRGPEVFDTVLKNLERLREHARFAISFTLMKSNLGRVRECIQLSRKLGARAVVFRPLYPTGTALKNPHLMPTFEEYTQAMRDIGPESDGVEPVTQRAVTCGAGRNICSVSVQGDVNPCSFMGPSFQSGNIRKVPFAEIWNRSQQFRLMREPVGQGGFDGGCRARSLQMSGSVEAADPWMREHQANGFCLHPSDNLEYAGRLALPMI